MQRKRYSVLHVRHVPVDVKAQFKAYCARHGYTMEAACTALMKEAVRRDLVLIGARTRP